MPPRFRRRWVRAPRATTPRKRALSGALLPRDEPRRWLLARHKGLGWRSRLSDRRRYSAKMVSMFHRLEEVPSLRVSRARPVVVRRVRS